MNASLSGGMSSLWSSIRERLKRYRPARAFNERDAPANTGAARTPCNRWHSAPGCRRRQQHDRHDPERRVFKRVGGDDPGHGESDGSQTGPGRRPRSPPRRGSGGGACTSVTTRWRRPMHGLLWSLAEAIRPGRPAPTVSRWAVRPHAERALLTSQETRRTATSSYASARGRRWPGAFPPRTSRRALDPDLVP